MKIAFWSKGGVDAADAALAVDGREAGRDSLPLEEGKSFYAGRLQVVETGMLVLQIRSPRPVRIWLDGTLVLDESLFWRSFEREVRAAVLWPCVTGDVHMRVEVGSRPVHPAYIDRDCPSRNRERVMRELKIRLPDVLTLAGTVQGGVRVPAVSLRFLPAQFVKEGVTWQHVLVRTARLPDQPPSTNLRSPADAPGETLLLASSVLPRFAQEESSLPEQSRGWRRFFVPVQEPGLALAPVRAEGASELRIEPALEIVSAVRLTVEGATGTVALDMPVFESLGRLAPQREYRDVRFPAYAAARPNFPEPLLTPGDAWMGELYYAAWEMLLGLVRYPAPASGLPGPYISTGSGFVHHQFVWDTSFTAMATVYGHRILPATASMDLLYSRQFEGGYIHREHDVRDGLPALYEPDFSPNPPIMSVTELAMARVTGDILRLRRVYPGLKANHAWLCNNRRQPDGTYWTTGLANGLDNSPSLGDGYPCLTAQMAHEAESLATIAGLLGCTDEAAIFRQEYAATSVALNARLWSDSQQIYATSLAGGGHNTNKVVTAFWPLWAGVVPPERVEALAGHLKDPASFWRYHPIPSLAADSPHFQTAGNYWLGSTWAPTNFAAIQGFDRAGCHELAYETAMRHLTCMYEVWKDTGKIYENYCSDGPRKGSWSMPDYCWSAAGPIALFFEVVMGVRLDAISGVIRFRPPSGKFIGVRNLPFGPGTVTILHHPDGAGAVEITTDRALTLEVLHADRTLTFPCTAGSHRFSMQKT